MKFRHVFLLFGAILLLAFGGALAKDAAAQAQALRELYPASTQGFAEFQSYYDEETKTGGVALDSEVYCRPPVGNNWEMVAPIAVEPEPFGWLPQTQGNADEAPRFFHVKGTDDWIYEVYKVSRAGHTSQMLCRAGTEKPTAARATALYLVTEHSILPMEETQALLLDEGGELLRAAVRALEGEGVPEKRLRAGVTLQFRSRDYPGVALEIITNVDRAGNYYFRRVNFREENGFRMPYYTALPLGEALSRAINEAQKSK